MPFLSREATAEDLHDLLRLAYSPAPTAKIIEDVRREWSWLWRTRRFLSVAVVDGIQGPTVGLLGAIHLTEEAFQILRTSKAPYVNRRLARVSLPNDRLLPADSHLVDGTATAYLAYFAWSHDYSIDELPILRGVLANAFLDYHGGYSVKRLCVEVRGVDNRDLALKQGAQVVNDYQEWIAAHGTPDSEKPFLLAIDREDALRTENHWYSRLFRYQPATLGFNSGQREMLRFARVGLTDMQLADRLSISHAGVKKRWEGIYARFHENLPGVLPLGEGGTRGAEKRRLAMRYLQDRLEELRP